MRPNARRTTPDARRGLILPEVVDCTAREAELPAFVTLGAHAHGIGWRHLVRLWFAATHQTSDERPATRPAARPIVVDVGGKTEAQRHAALAATFAGGGVTKIEIIEVHRLADLASCVARDASCGETEQQNDGATG